MNYGFHPSIMSLPVAGTFAIEPTEPECKAKIDLLAGTMISIKGEIMAIHNGELDAENNPLKNTPHTADVVTGD